MSRRTPAAANDASSQSTLRGKAVTTLSLWREAPAVLVTAFVLSWMFWAPLWRDAGLVGGDLYSYYFPQKMVLADSLREGTIPLWNSRVGFGYPVLGESQTGALYPPNLLLYRILPLNVAYNLSQLAHYLLAFVAAYVLSRRLGIGPAGSLLAATTYVYGWFPPRICLEWSIIGGCWYAVVLSSAVAFIQTARARYLVHTAFSLGLLLFAGHYNIAFLAVLTLLVWPWLTAQVTGASRNSRAILLTAAIGCGFLIAAMQLVPTWELKAISQRQHISSAFAPTDGHIPPLALSQLWMPWAWYAGSHSMDDLLRAARWLAVPTGTNQVEAQLYVGLIPLILALTGWLIPSVRRRLNVPRPLGWLTLMLVSLLFATGWPTYWLQALPGIGFFRGPGRYSLLAVLAMAIVAGATFDVLLQRWGTRRGTRGAIVTFVLAVVSCDLWLASRQYDVVTPGGLGRHVFYARMIDDYPLKYLEKSSLRRFFAQVGQNARLYAPGANIPTLLGVSSLPVYLGLAPALYESSSLLIDFAAVPAAEVEQTLERLRNFGVTHLLLQEPLDLERWPLKLLDRPFDALLNRAYARPEPFYLYEVPSPKGRASFQQHPNENRVLAVREKSNGLEIDVECASADRLVLRDLWYPGWTVAGAAAQPAVFDEAFRAIDLEHTGTGPQKSTISWSYRPASVLWGSLVSAAGLLATAILAWRVARARRLTETGSP